MEMWKYVYVAYAAVTSTEHMVYSKYAFPPRKSHDESLGMRV